MDVCGGTNLISMFYRGGLAVLCVLALSACSERELSIAFLKSVSGDSDFKIVNAKNENDVDAKDDFTTVPLEVSCSESVSAIEVFDSATSSWVDPALVDTQADVDCSDKVASFALPLGFLDFPLNPTESGVVKKDFKLRWSYQSVTGEMQTQSRTYTAVSTPPEGQVVASDITATNESSYSVSGTCSGTGAVEVSGPFVAPLTVICSNGTWTVHPQVDTNYPYLSGIVAKFYLGSGTALGPFTEKVVNVRLDVLPPTVSISEPTMDQVYTAMDTVHFKGLCSESLRTVTILQGATELGTTNCTAANTFDVELPTLADGNYLEVKAVQFDEVGNQGESSGVNFKRDTTGPGAFNITGVVSKSGADSTTDWLLTAPGLKIYITEAPEAVKYKASVNDNTGVTVCPWQETTEDYFDFSGCSLFDSSTYKIQVVGYDEYDNSTMALNNGQSFSVNYDRPQVISVTSTSMGSFKAGKSVDILVRFDKNINVSVTPTAPKLKMNVGSYATFTSVSGSDTMVFQYVVQDGENTSRLEYLNLSALEGGSITMPVTDLEAARDLPPLGTSQLAEKNIVIDTIPPAPPTALNIGVARETGFTPSFNWMGSASADLDKYRVEVFNGNTMALLKYWEFAAPASGLTAQELPETVPLSRSTPVSVRVYAIDKAGNYSAVLEGSYTTPVCPINYILVPGRGSVAAFCVAKYEMKYGKQDGYDKRDSSTVLPLSSKEMRPWTGLTISNAMNRCQLLADAEGLPPLTYNLISPAQWQVLATHISEQPVNWVSSVLGGQVKSGVTRSSGAIAPVDALMRCYPSASCAGDSVNDRAFSVNGALIWDIAGNAAEWNFSATAANTDPNNVPLEDGADYISNSAVPALFGPTGTVACSTSGASPYCGYGKYVRSSQANRPARGGSVNDYTDDVGIFATEGVLGTVNTRPDIGFRCVYNP